MVLIEMIRVPRHSDFDKLNSARLSTIFFLS